MRRESINSSLKPNNTQGSICLNDNNDKSILDKEVEEDRLNKVLEASNSVVKQQERD